MKKLNIVIISDYAYIEGGAGKVALSSALALADMGHNVILFSSVGPVSEDIINNYDNIKVICAQQYDILNNPNRYKAIIQGFWNFRAAKLMKNLLNTLNTEDTVLHVHTWTKALSSSAIKIAIKKGFRVVFTLHDYFISCPNGGLFNYQKNELCNLRPMSIKCICKNCDRRMYAHKLWRVIRQAVQNYLGCVPRKIKHFITISKTSQELLKPLLPLDVIVHYVSNPIDVSNSININASENKTFTFVGRLSEEKGTLLLAKAAKITGYDVVFVGDGDMKNKILEECSNAKITGWVSKEEVINYLSNTRVLVLPSLLYETQGLTVLEAASIGIPAIIPNTSAATEFVIDGINGLHFKRNSVDDLVKKMMIMNDDKTVNAMGISAYHKFWSQAPIMSKHVLELYNVYKQVLQE